MGDGGTTGSVSDTAQVLTFERFFSITYQRVVAALAVSIGDKRAAEDAAQDAFAKALTRWDRVGQMARPDAWVIKVAVRASRRSLARAERHHQRLVATIERTPEVVAQDGLDDSGLLDGLTPRERLAVVLRYVEDLTMEEAAAAMGCKVGTVKATIHSAVTKLRRDLAPEPQEPSEVSDE
jgi:RNA polymerase sigma factor (sigma-70 family)